MAMAMASRKGARKSRSVLEKTTVQHALQNQTKFGNAAAMQRNRRELADIFDWTVPGKTVVEIRDNAEIDAMSAAFSSTSCTMLAFALRGEEDLVHKLLARMLEERFKSANNVS